MPYLSRRHQLGSTLLYHIFNRGNGLGALFRAPQDYQYFISLLRRYATKHTVNIYHWVIMPTHYHLLLEIDEPEKIPSLMAGLARAYAFYYHKKYRTFGHLWQCRFKSQALYKQTYLMSCGRYIERKPVQAKMVSFAGDYTYSSASFYLFGKKDGITAQDPLFAGFGLRSTKRRRRYSEFLNSPGLDQDKLFENLESPQGSKEFLKRLIKENGLFLPRRRGRARK